MKSTLYMATDNQFIETLKRFVDNSLISESFAKILVYQSVSGRTGFDVDTAGQKLVYQLLHDSYVFSPLGNKTAFSNSTGSFEVDALSFLNKGGQNSVAFVGMNQEMNKLITEFSEYSNKRRNNEIRERYGKQAIELETPILAKLFESEPKKYFETLVTISKLCSRVMIWPSYGGGFGMHVIIISKDHARYYAEIIEKWAKSNNCMLNLSTNREMLPAW